MKGKGFTALSIALLAVFCWVNPSESAQKITVEVTNVTNGIYFTPLLVTAHDGSTRLFQAGVEASDSLQLMAECGDISLLLFDLGGEDGDTVADPAGGLLPPGGSATAELYTKFKRNIRISIVGMLLPTNDGFVGLDSLEVPMAPGTYTYYLNGYDAGTEGNSELLDTSGCAPGMPGIPAAPGGDAGTGGTGVAADDTNPSVHVHRGNLGDMNPVGGPSDLDSAIHRWLNPVAKVVITVKKAAGNRWGRY